MRLLRLASTSVCTVLHLGLVVVHGGYEVPGVTPSGPVVLEHATVHTVHGETIEDGVVIFRDGRITQLGRSGRVTIPDSEDTQRLDLTGKQIYPGLIDADSAMGLIEIDAVRATRDQDEVGLNNPSSRAAIAFSPDSEMIPVARSGGVLLTLSVPRGGLVSGQSSLMRLDGWTGDEMTVVPTVGMHVNWPSSVRRSSDSEAEDRVEILTDLFDNARDYARSMEQQSVHAFDAALAAMQPVLRRETPLFVAANSVQLIQEAIAFSQQQQIKLVIVGGYDAALCADLLKRHQIPVIVSGTHRLPRRRQADYDEPFRIPSQLRKAGVQFCIGGYDRSSASLVQNLADQAGTAAAFGLSRADAVRSITLWPAEILGVADRYGSLEAGKSATLIVTSGDVLEIVTKVEMAWLDGRPVDLNNRHKRLWKKYQQRYRDPSEDGG